MNTYRKGALVFGDIISFILGFFTFGVLVYGFSGITTAITLHALPFTLLVVIWIGVFFIFNFYELRNSKPNAVFLRNMGIASVIMLAIGFIYFYINPQTRITPKLNLVIFEYLSLVFVLGFRRIFYLATMNSFHTRFAIVCSEEKFHSLVSEIAENPQLGFQNQGIFTSLTDFVTTNPTIDLLIIHKTSEHETELLEKILASNIEVIDLPEAYETILYKIPVDFIDNQWIVRSITKGSDIFYRALSRIISILFAIVVGIITLPISLVIMIAIKLEDGGPILYKNDRIGKNGNTFFLYKFRSMIPDAEKNGAQWAQVVDNRVTKVGAITRKLHIDEIPQMINLLRGDLDLVGPRPERPEFVQQLERDIPYYFMRHTITPGFTGWAQIKFRYARTVMDSREKFEYDLYYIKNRNLFLDFGIIMKTAQIVFTHAGK